MLNTPRASALALAAAVLTGCGGKGAPAQADAAKATAAWQAARGHEDEVYRLQRRLETRCMEKKGFRTHPSGQPPNLEDRGRRSVLGDPLPPTPQEAATRGYGFAVNTDAATSPPETTGTGAWEASPASYKQKYLVAYEGPRGVRATADSGTNVTFPAQGCAGEVLKELMGDQLGAYIRLQDLSANGIRAEAQASIDEGAKEALNKAWDRCMAAVGERGLGEPEGGRGRAMARAEQAGTDPERRAEAIAAEKAMAAKDATCAQQLDYENKLTKIEGDASTDVLARHLPDLLAFQQILADASVRARSLMTR